MSRSSRSWRATAWTAAAIALSPLSATYKRDASRLVPTGAQMVAGYANEVGDVLGEQHVAFCHGGGHHVKVRPTGEPRLGDGAGVNAARAERLGQRRRVHFVEEQLQDLDAAAVSWRCSSIRASTSPGYMAR